MKKTRTRLMSWAAVCLLSAALSVMFLPGTVLAANKAARLKVTYFPEKGENDPDEEWSKNAYQFEVTMKAKTVLAKQNYESAKILVPKSMFKKSGDAIQFMLNMSACTKKNGEYVTRFYCQSGLWFEFTIAGKRKELHLYDEFSDKMRDASKYASVKEKGKYYVLTFKNIPVCRRIFDAKLNDNDPKWKPTSAKYYLTPVLFYHCNFSYKGSGYVCLDQVSVKAKKTRAVTFNKVDYPRLVAFNLFKRKNMKVDLVKF